MKRINSISRCILLISCFSVIVFGCSGGGGSSSDSSGGGGSTPTISYVGLSTPATITESNSEDLVFGSLLGVETGTYFALSAESQDEQPQDEQAKTVSNHPNVIDLPLVLKNTSKNINFTTSKRYPLSTAVSAVRTTTETINGNCGGTAKYTLNINDTTGVYDGTFIFSQYCEDGILISGDTNINGTVNLVTGEIITITYEFQNLTVDDFIYNGNVFVNDAAAPQIITLDLLAKDSASDKVYWAKEYSILITEINATDSEIDVTGTYYDPDQGYVTVSTPEPLLVSTEDWPILGALLCIGDKNTKALLTVINKSSYKIEADTNGDDTYDYNSGILIWPGATPLAWESRTSMQTLRPGLAAGVVNGQIYAIGGFPGINWVAIGANPLNNVEEYDPVFDTWKAKSPMPTARGNLGVGVVNGKLYAVGGTTKVSVSVVDTNVVEEYDQATDTWTTKSPMPTARSLLSAAVVNGKMYLIGGDLGSGNYTGLVEEYDPSSDSWATKTSMPTPRGGFAVSVVDNKIYAIGGGNIPSGNLDVVEVYDPSNDTWNTKSSMPTKRQSLVSGVVNGEIYLIGGSGFNARERIVEKYNPITDIWSSKTSMPVVADNCAAAVANEKIYVIGAGDYSEVYEYDSLLDP